MTPDVREAENVFLSIFREDSDRDYINKKIQCFQACDWNKLYEFAIQSGFSSAFYNRLLSLKLNNIPAEFLSRLKNLYFLNLKSNLLLEQELFQILSYLKELDIPVIPLKGPILAMYLYNDLALRQASADLDLLVKYEAMDEIAQKLQKLGYSFFFTDCKRDFLFPRELAKPIRQIMLTKNSDETGLIILDLHWCIRGFFLDHSIRELWQQARYYNLDGQEILLLSNEDNLLYLSTISISTLEFVQLKYIYDIHRLVSIFKEELDWDKLLCKAKNLNLENCLYFPLKLSTILFWTDVPKAFLSNIEPNWIPRRLIGLYINQKSALGSRQKVRSTLLLRYLLGRYLYSSSLTEFLSKSFRRISSHLVSP